MATTKKTTSTKKRTTRKTKAVESVSLAAAAPLGNAVLGDGTADADLFLSKIKAGSTTYKLKDPTLNAIGLAIKGITTIAENASTKELAQKLNEILGKFSTLTCVALICGISIF